MRRPHAPEPATRPEGPPELPPGVAHISEPLARVADRLAAAGIEPMLGIDDLAAALSCDRRTIERMRAAGKLPRPDLTIGRSSPRWKPATVRAWIDQQAKGGRASR